MHIGIGWYGKCHIKTKTKPNNATVTQWASPKISESSSKGFVLTLPSYSYT